jgi:hypothetical protein
MLSHMIPIHISKSSLLRYIFIFSPFLHIGFQDNLILSGFPIRILYEFLFFLIHEICSTHLILLDMKTIMVLGDKYKSWHSSLLSILPPYLSSSLLISKYSLVTRFSNTLGCILVSVWVTSLGPMPNKSNIILTYFSFVFMYMQKRQNILYPNDANTPQIWPPVLVSIPNMCTFHIS